MAPGEILLGIVMAALLVGVVAPAIADAPNLKSLHGTQQGPPIGGDSAFFPTATSRADNDAGHGVDTDTNLTYTESGLPSGTAWEVSIERNGSLFATDDTTNRSSLTEALPDGSYDFAAGANLSDYATYAAPSTVNLSGGNATVPLHFYRGFDLAFSVVGLPFNETWNISLTADGVTQNRTVAGGSTDFWIPVGAFSYADSAAGYVSLLGSGIGQLSGNSSISLDFERAKPYLGILKVTIDVPSADVYLNGDLNSGVAEGTTTFNVTPGIWSVYVHAPGYGDYFNVTTIRSNQTVTMVVHLQPNSVNPGPALLSGTAQLIIVCLVAGIAVIAVLFVIAWSRLARS